MSTGALVLITALMLPIISGSASFQPVARSTEQSIHGATPADRSEVVTSLTSRSPEALEPWRLRETAVDGDAGSLHFADPTVTAPARFIDDGTPVSVALNDGTSWEARVLGALLEGDEETIREYTEPTVADYLPREMLDTIGPVDRSPLGMYQLVTEGDSPRRIVVVDRTQLFEILLYVDFGRIVDGEVIVRSRSRAESLSQESLSQETSSQGTYAAPGILP